MDSSQASLRWVISKNSTIHVVVTLMEKHWCCCRVPSNFPHRLCVLYKRNIQQIKHTRILNTYYADFCSTGLRVLYLLPKQLLKKWSCGGDIFLYTAETSTLHRVWRGPVQFMYTPNRLYIQNTQKDNSSMYTVMLYVLYTRQAF